MACTIKPSDRHKAEMTATLKLQSLRRSISSSGDSHEVILCTRAAWSRGNLVTLASLFKNPTLIFYYPKHSILPTPIEDRPWRLGPITAGTAVLSKPGLRLQIIPALALRSCIGTSAMMHANCVVQSPYASDKMKQLRRLHRPTIQRKKCHSPSFSKHCR